MPSEYLSSLIEELQSTAAADSRAELALTACDLLDPPCVEIGWQLVEAAMKLGAESPKNRFHRIVEDDYDKLKPDFKALSPPQRAAVLKAVCGELGDAVAAAWEHMADFQYGRSYLSMAFRSPSTRDANFDRLYAWLKDIVSILYTFPVGLVTPEWIAVHAGGIEDPTRMFYSGLDGVLGDGDSPQDAFGTLLGSVIAGDGESSDNVFETLSLIADGEHPVGVVNSYLFRALWRSGQYRGYEVLTGLIAGVADEGSVESAMVIGLIVHSARESGPVAMGIAIESVLTHRVLMQDHVAVVIGAWIKVPLEKKSESERYEIVRQLLESLQNLEQLKANVASANISGRDAGLLLFAQAYEDTAAIPELAGQLYQRVPADDRTEFAMALARIETPSEVEPNAEVWLSLAMDDDLSVSVPILLYSTRAPKCDPENLWTALEIFANHLPLELGADAPLIPGDDKSRLQDLRQKLADFAYGIADGMPTERLVKILSWTIRGLKWKFWEPPEAFRSILNAIDLSDEAVREIVVETVCEDSYLASVLAPDLIRVGLKDADRQWLVPLLRENYISQELIDASLEIPSQQLIDILINPLLTDQNKNERLRGCTFLRWICAKTENPPDWIATAAEKVLSDPLKDVRHSALTVFIELVKKGQSLEQVVSAIIRHENNTKLTQSERSSLKYIRELLPKKLRKRSQEHTAKKTLKRVPRSLKAIRKLTRSFGANEAQEADFIDAWQDALVGDPSIARCTATNFRFIADHPAGSRRAEYQEMVDRYVQQTTDVLLGEKSDATEDAIKIGTLFCSIRGTDNLFKLLKVVGNKKFKRLKSRDQNKTFDLICQLITVSIPSPGETSAEFSDKVDDAIKAQWLTRERLIKLAVYAPQWAGWIECALDARGLKDAALWFASFADHRLAIFMEFNLTIVSSDPTQFPFIAKAQHEEYDKRWLAKRSQLGRRQDFSITPQWYLDTDWFQRAKAGVDSKIWMQLLATVPLLHPPKACERLLNIIAAMSGDLVVTDLKNLIETEEPGIDTVQLLALLPVANITDSNARILDLANRVRLIQRHARLAKKLKVAKRDTAMAANANARKILATVSGIEDPDRLDWYAMTDLKERIDAVSPLTIDDATLSLDVQPNGQPVIIVESDGKKRKTIPKAIAKNKDVLQLKSLLKELKADAKQVLKSFEMAMIDEVRFGVEEIISFLENPLLRPPLRSLVLSHGDNFGTPEVVDGKLYLSDATGEQTDVSSDGELSIAHAYDLFSADCLASWREAFSDRVQAIEQLQREIFKPTKQELADGLITRFADFTIRENQARAIFQSMGWRTEQNFGPCWFAKKGPDGIHASVRLEWVTGAEDSSGNWPFCVTEIDFYKNEQIPIDKVDPKFLSEIIRQVNQVVSVAEQG